MLLEQKAEKLLATVAGVTMTAAGGKVTLYTVPAGFKAIITKIVVRTISATLAGATSNSWGGDSNADDFKTGVDLSSITSPSGKVYQVTNPNAAIIEYAAATVFGYKPTTGSTGAATATMDVFGYLVAV